MSSIYSHFPTPKSQHYLNRYIKLIDYVMSHPNVSGYVERHHILPKSMGGSNKKENLIKFTARQHFLAHWMLWKAYQNKSMASAFWLMRHAKSNGQERYQRLNSTVYGQLRENYSKHLKSIIGSMHHRYGATNNGRKHSEETKDNIRKSKLGKRHSDEVKRNMSLKQSGSRNHMFGKKHSKETLEKMKLAQKKRLASLHK